MVGKRVVTVVSLGLLAAVVAGQPVFADRYSSTNYTIDAGVTGNSVGGLQTSTNYALTSSGGESAIGNGTSGSYKMGQGYVSQLDQSIQLNISPTPINLGTVTPGVPGQTTITATVLTDAPGYNLYVNQDHDLTSGGTTIPAISGSIGAPATWVNGTTKGLGFTLVSTTATAIPGKWSSGAAYAAFPNASTSFYTRTGLSGGTTDTLTIRAQLDVTSAQTGAAYSNTLTWVGTITP